MAEFPRLSFCGMAPRRMAFPRLYPLARMDVAYGRLFASIERGCLPDGLRPAGAPLAFPITRPWRGKAITNFVSPAKDRDATAWTFGSAETEPGIPSSVEIWLVKINLARNRSRRRAGHVSPLAGLSGTPQPFTSLPAEAGVLVKSREQSKVQFSAFWPHQSGHTSG
jgi:hypothetical protein